MIVHDDNMVHGEQSNDETWGLEGRNATTNVMTTLSPLLRLAQKLWEYRQE